MSHFLPDQTPSDAVIERFLANACSVAERDAVRAWAGTTGEGELLAERVRTALLTPSGALGEPPAPQAVLAAIQQELQHFSGAHRSNVAPPQLRSVRYRSRSVGFRLLGGLVVAAAAVAVVVATTTRQTIVGAAHVYRTAAGERSTIQLREGALAVLAPATSVSFDGNLLTVDGEVSLRVAPSSDRPFVVRTREMSVHVLGTSFTVRQYADERASRVVVMDGRVVVRRNGSPNDGTTQTVLDAGTLAHVSDSGIIVKRNIPVAQYTGWTEGRLSFERTPLRDVVAELGRAYAREIRVPDSALAAMPVTMSTVINDESLADVLEYLTFAVKAHYTQKNKTFVIEPGRSSSQASKSRQHFQQEKRYGR
jgi:ferric-dicitrate binding protein FerR (iron transport regulator)